MSKSRQIGSTFIITGTTIGAGMLALPMISAGEGFAYAILALVILWALMLYGALLLLEVNLNFPHGASFSTLAKQCLGRFGQFITNLCMVLLFYCLTAAYISGGSDFLTTDLSHFLHVELPKWINALIFTVILGGLVTWKTLAVDMANRFLLSVKMIAFFIVIFLLIPNVHWVNLTTPVHGEQFILMCIPIFFTAFGFHGSIPSIVKYIGHEPKTLKNIFIIGSVMPLILYILWEMVTLGILPRSGNLSFATIAQQKGTVDIFINFLSALISQPVIQYGVNFFTNIAMTTSFLGVTLGLFDFFADIFRAKEQVSRRLGVGMITFLPPLLFALFYPRGFIAALGYAAIPLALLAIVFPALMAWKTRRENKNAYPYKVRGGSLALIIMVLAGMGIILLQLLSILKILPVFP